MATPASAAGSIYYGSRVGMEVTITSMSGIGGTNAIIRAVHTRANARTFCLEYARDSSEACIREELSTRLSDHIAANCKSGVFTTFYGETLRFLGPNKNSDFGSPKYKLVSLASGRPLDGSSASGYSYDIEQFSALCPGLIEPEQ
ncbi:MAG: hypothetical protein JO068_15535 [Hyphomicrobiales bacterium]|nr:hypothetical protein [Hyphomicrobiales bacterium]